MPEQVIITAESFNIEKKKEGEGFIIRGLALPFGKRSRNGLIYNRESCIATIEQWKGLPILFNHDENKPVGHIIKAEAKEDGIYYVGDLDPQEEAIIRKVKRGDIPFVSIQAIVDRAGEDVEGDVIVKEWLELSLCTIAGFPQTFIEIEKFVKPKEDEFKGANPTETKAKEPFAGFKDWDECIKKMKEQGYDEETAKKICGSLKKKYEAVEQGKDKTPNFDMSKCIDRLSKVEGISDPAKVCQWIYQQVKAGNRKNPFSEFFKAENEENNICGDGIHIMMNEKELMEMLSDMKKQIEELRKEQEEPAEPTPEDKIAELETKIAEIEAKLELIEKKVMGEEPTEEPTESGEGIERQEALTREEFINAFKGV